MIRYNKEENLNQLIYFIIAILVVGSIGIWLPPFLEGKMELKSFSINLTTFFTTIVVAGSMDFILKSIDSESQNLKLQFLKSIAGLIASIGWIVLILVFLTLKEWEIVPLIMAIIGSIASLLLWWHNNLDNPIFNDKIRSEGNEIHGKKWK
ncbi:hypothetical protein [Cellulophaga sp. Ld12]|uniref:hypothetical protein n=1 Tax=Cellulophaga sp. Ld12 TaxID=3229535 RepID=UPI003863C539